METRIRSIAKTTSWRVVATTMTFAISYFWLHDLASSLALALVANAMKTLVYYFHERIWNALEWERFQVVETRLRSFAKSMSWRVLAGIVTFAASYFWFDTFKDSVSFVAIAMTVKMLLYYVHERGWNAVQWGRILLPSERFAHEGITIGDKLTSDAAAAGGV